jgi:hypothetical protein
MLLVEMAQDYYTSVDPAGLPQYFVCANLGPNAVFVILDVFMGALASAFFCKVK